MVELNPQIESSLWATVLIYILTKGYADSGMDYNEFKNDVNQAFEHYKFLWD